MMQSKIKMKSHDFYTRGDSDKGVKYPLELPDGVNSGEWLRVVGSESSLYEKAHEETVRSVLAGDNSDGKQSYILLAALVIDWSFDEPCTTDTVIKFLKNAPYIKHGLDRFVVNRVNFYKKK